VYAVHAAAPPGPPTFATPTIALRVTRTASASSVIFSVPERPVGTETMNEEQLASLITRDAMVGVAKVTLPSSRGNA
jgi:hypothetical protein